MKSLERIEHKSVAQRGQTVVENYYCPSNDRFSGHNIFFRSLGQYKSSIEIAFKTHLNSKKNKNGRQLELMMVKQAWVSVRFYFF